MRTLPLPLIALALLAGFACTTSNLKSTDIVAVIPWSGPETSQYRVLDDGKEVGTLTMTIDEEGSGALSLGQEFDFPDKGFVNKATVVADAASLQPQSTSYRIEGPEGNLQCDAEYDGSKAAVHRVGEDGERTDDIVVPQIAYDSWSDLFAWRTIEFSKGYSVEYTDILSCTLDRAQKLGVKLTVKAREEITVTAGTFEAWRLEIDSGGETQKAWFTTDNERRLLKYDNGRQVFDLVE